MKTMKKLLSVIIALALAVTLVPATGQAAKKKPILCMVKVNIAVGGKLQLKFKNLKKGKKVIWSSSNKSVATVSKKGMLTAKKAGKAKITAKVDKKKYTCAVTVKNNKNDVKIINSAGKNKSDVAALTKIIVEQKKKGIDLCEDLDNLYFYRWNEDGRLIFIAWHTLGVSGTISFAGLTALKELYCYDSKLTSLDVSKNVALEVLSCGENKLTSLDVSNNVALKELSCYENQLTSLDVTKNVALNTLECNKNKLTSLDVTKNVALEVLRCNENKLTSLDVTKNVALEVLWCNENQLTSLDLSNNNIIWDLQYDKDKVAVIGFNNYAYDY